MYQRELKPKTLTDAQFSALCWLNRHGSTGVFMKDQVLLAQGERAPVMRATWNILRDQAFIEVSAGRVTVREQFRHLKDFAVADHRRWNG